jgi:hypothetical protein
MTALQFSVYGVIFLNCCFLSRDIHLFMIMYDAIIVWLVSTGTLLGTYEHSALYHSLGALGACMLSDSYSCLENYACLVSSEVSWVF